MTAGMAEDGAVVPHGEKLNMRRRLSGARERVFLAGTTHTTLPRLFDTQPATADFV